jgi:hypothetical protein
MQFVQRTHINIFIPKGTRFRDLSVRGVGGMPCLGARNLIWDLGGWILVLPDRYITSCTAAPNVQAHKLNVPPYSGTGPRVLLNLIWRPQVPFPPSLHDIIASPVLYLHSSSSVVRDVFLDSVVLSHQNICFIRAVPDTYIFEESCTFIDISVGMWYVKRDTHEEEFVKMGYESLLF